jgi:DNA helicase II / ATP-dependent DNA helicase PcrA
MTRLASGNLVISKTANIRKRFQELQERLNALVGLNGRALVDVLFSEGNSSVQGLREASLLACDADEISSPAALLDYLRTRITQPEMPEEGQFVRVMSLHKSKGLTSRVVIVCGCVEGLIPFRKEDAPSVEQAAIIREQRRLFYVAVTRCTEVLVLSSFRRLPRDVAYKIGAKVRGEVQLLPRSQVDFLVN